MTTTDDIQLDTLLKTYQDTIAPLEPMLPSQWAERYRHLDPAEAEQYGKWRNDVFPALGPIQDAALEVINRGMRGLVIMKAAQGGCSQAVKNIWGYCETFFPGPAGYLISKDELAKKFGRTRFDHMIRTCLPLRVKAILGRGSGSSSQEKVFTDGYLSIFGGRSVLNLQSIPYRFMFIDEVDSLLDVMDGSDPIELARKRTNSYVGETLIVAFGHPSVKSRGSGKLYYTDSDQRRGYVTCRGCAKQFWLDWAHVELIIPPGEGDAAKLRAENYHLLCPYCRVNVSDADRVMMLREVEFKSELSEVDQVGRTWIGMHFNELYYPHKPLKTIVEDFLACRDDDTKVRTFYNKTLGEPYESTLKKFTPAIWQKCIVVPISPNESKETREDYLLGQVPRGVTAITAGQDSGKTDLYWSVWGWTRQLCDDEHFYLRGWLIDYGMEKRNLNNADVNSLTAQDLTPFDHILFNRTFRSELGDTMEVSLAGMDSGWQPQSVYQYCLRWPGRAVPVKGSNEPGKVSGYRVDYQNTAKTIQWGAAVSHQFDGEVVRSPIRPAMLNTYQLKMDFFTYATKGLTVRGRRVPVLALPSNVSELLLRHLCGERLCQEESRTGKEKLAWKQTGPNHWLDTSIYAFACALNLEPIMETSAKGSRGAPVPVGYVPDEENDSPLYRL